jgi:hypothetical protein
MKHSVNVHLGSWLRDPQPSRPMAIFDEPADQPVAGLAGAAVIRFEYPLDREAIRTVEVGTTVADFVSAVAREYEAIYREEAEDGRHAIWGHGLGDLFLEGFQQRPDGSWDLLMGS